MGKLHDQSSTDNVSLYPNPATSDTRLCSALDLSGPPKIWSSQHISEKNEHKLDDGLVMRAISELGINEQSLKDFKIRGVETGVVVNEVSVFTEQKLELDEPYHDEESGAESEQSDNTNNCDINSTDKKKYDVTNYFIWEKRNTNWHTGQCKYPGCPGFTLGQFPANPEEEIDAGEYTWGDPSWICNKECPDDYILSLKDLKRYPELYKQIGSEVDKGSRIASHVHLVRPSKSEFHVRRFRFNRPDEQLEPYRSIWSIGHTFNESETAKFKDERQVYKWLDKTENGGDEHPQREVPLEKKKLSWDTFRSCFSKNQGAP